MPADSTIRGKRRRMMETRTENGDGNGDIRSYAAGKSAMPHVGFH